MAEFRFGRKVIEIDQPVIQHHNELPIRRTRDMRKPNSANTYGVSTFARWVDWTNENLIVAARCLVVLDGMPKIVAPEITL